MVNKLLILLVSLFFIYGCATVGLEQQQEAEFYYKMGISYLNEGNIQMAFVNLQKAYQFNPESIEIMNSLGLVYLQLDDFENAKQLFSKAVSVNPKFSEAHNNLGVAYINTGQWSEAIESFKNALSNLLYTSPEMAFYNLGVSYYKTGQINEAINAFKDSIRRANSYPLPYYGLSLAYNRAGRYGDASAAILKALEVDPAYKGNRAKFIEFVRQKLITAKGDEESDLRQYLDILMY